MTNNILNNIDTKEVWIDVETVAKLKDITKRAVRLSLSNDKYEYKVETVKGGKTYKIKLSSLEENFQVKYIEEYYNDFKTIDNEIIELSNFNIKQEKLISESQKKIALAKYDLISCWLNYRKDFKKQKFATDTNPDKQFLELYNTGILHKEIFKTLGKTSIGSLYRWRALLTYNSDWTTLVGQYKYSTRKEYNTTLNEEQINHTVLIRSSKYKFYNRIHKENLDRTLYIPDLLFNQIPRHQKGQVFMKVNVPNYDTLINTHVYLSIKHNIPLNIISKNIGYTCFDDFLNRFDFALSHDFIHKINILGSI